MSAKSDYEQKIKTHFDECKAQVALFKAEASALSADAGMEMNNQIKQLEAKMEEGKVKLAELKDASEDKFDALKKGVEKIWQSTKSTLHHASKHFGKS